MNIYVVVEGERAAKKLYRSWIPLVNPNLRAVDYAKEASQNNFYVLAGFGQPEIRNRIQAAILEMRRWSQYERLVIALDSEGLEPANVQQSLKDFVDPIRGSIDVRYVIQHVCMETWLLGNRHLIKTRMESERLKEYVAIFDARSFDPELISKHPKRGWNQAQFTYEYLRAGIQDVYGRTRRDNSYTKGDPGPTVSSDFFDKVQRRYRDMKHIQSFEKFLDAFQ